MAYPESVHPYLPNVDETQTYTEPGSPANIWVTFDAQTEVESGYDYIYIYTGADVLVGTYTGTALAGKTVSVSGDTVKVRLTSDGSVQEWGYAVAAVSITEPPIVYPVVVSPGPALAQPIPCSNYPGPFDYGSALYAGFADFDAYKYRIFRSLNNGGTWAEMDSSNARAIYSWKDNSIVQYGGVLYTLYPYGANGTLRFAPFDLMADPPIWGADFGTSGGPEIVNSVPPPGYTETRYYPATVRRSDGSFVVVIHNEKYKTSPPTGYTNDMQYAIWSPSTGWSALANLIPAKAGTTQYGPIWLGAEDRVHAAVFDTSEGTGNYKLLLATLNPDGSKYYTDTGYYLKYSTTNDIGASAVVTYTVGSETWFALPFLEKNNYKVSVIRGISSNTIADYYKDDLGTLTSGTADQTPSVAVTASGALRATWRRFANDTYYREASVYYSQYSGVGNEKYSNSVAWSEELWWHEHAYDVKLYSFYLSFKGSERRLLYGQGPGGAWWGAPMYNRKISAGCRYRGF